MEGHLRRSDFFVGGRYTVPDVALYAYPQVPHEGGVEPFLRGRHELLGSSMEPKARSPAGS